MTQGHMTFRQAYLGNDLLVEINVEFVLLFRDSLACTERTKL